MNAPRLDRLSALLEGLAPTVLLDAGGADEAEVPACPATGSLRVYLLTGGVMRVRSPDTLMTLQAPALLAMQASSPHRMEAVAPVEQGRLIRARILLEGPVAPLFLEEFRQPRVLSLTEDEPALRLAVDLIGRELDAPRCGQPALLNRAGDILFIGLLRHLVAHPGPGGTGLFNGLADPRIARALVAMHQRPQADWSLESLASEAGMSRTAFARTFREVMRRTPGRYLSAIRLALAQRAVDAGKGLKEAARVAGYGNVSALSRALSRVRAGSDEPDPVPGRLSAFQAV